MEYREYRERLLTLTALCTRYCVAIQNSDELERKEFVGMLLSLLPRIYTEFMEIEPREAEDADGFGEGCFQSAFPSSELTVYVDEELYEDARRRMERLFGEEDSYLETFLEDMRYSETPIAATISEGLADLFQALFNFVAAVREGGSEMLEPAFETCRARFSDYWSQILCNILRPLNNLHFS